MQIVAQIKKPKHEESMVFHKIYWNLVSLTRDAAWETYAFMYAKPPYLVMKSYAPIFKHQS